MESYKVSVKYYPKYFVQLIICIFHSWKCCTARDHFCENTAYTPTKHNTTLRCCKFKKHNYKQKFHLSKIKLIH